MDREAWSGLSLSAKRQGYGAASSEDPATSNLSHYVTSETFFEFFHLLSCNTILDERTILLSSEIQNLPTASLNHNLTQPMSVITQLPPPSFPSSTTACPQCGTHVPVAFPSHALSPTETNSRIAELEAQLRLVNNKAAAAADKLADYEDEVRFLRAVHARKEQQQHGRNGSGGKEISRTGSPPADADLNGGLRPQATSRLSSFSAFLPMGRRNGSTSLAVPPSPGFPSASGAVSTPNLLNPSEPPAPSLATIELSELRREIQHEKERRIEAESQLGQSQRELEDLTAQLFSQANEMVAQERRARSVLEERVKVLEKRDGEKRRRLERLEGAVARIERVRGMVG